MRPNGRIANVERSWNYDGDFAGAPLSLLGPVTLVPQKLKVLFQGVCYTLGILNQKNLQPPEIIV